MPVPLPAEAFRALASGIHAFLLVPDKAILRVNYSVNSPNFMQEAVMQHQEGRQALADQHLACDEANGGDAAQDVTGQQAPAKERLDAEAVENLLQAIL